MAARSSRCQGSQCFSVGVHDQAPVGIILAPRLPGQNHLQEQSESLRITQNHASELGQPPEVRSQILNGHVQTGRSQRTSLFGASEQPPEAIEAQGATEHVHSVPLPMLPCQDCQSS